MGFTRGTVCLVHLTNTHKHKHLNTNKVRLPKQRGERSTDGQKRPEVKNRIPHKDPNAAFIIY